MAETNGNEPIRNEPARLSIEDDMRQSYLDYAMSVNIGRALPDLRDGLASGGIRVSATEVYRTRFLDADVSGLTTWLAKDGPVAAAFFSPSGVAALERLLPELSRAAVHERAAAIARGQTTAKALDDCGYRRVFRPGAEVTFETAAHEALLTMCGGRP